MRDRGSAAAVALVALVALAIGTLSSNTGAHGGRVQLAKAPAEPYLVSVWTLPDPVRAGSKIRRRDLDSKAALPSG